IPQFRPNRGPTASASTLPGPVAPEALTVPPHHRLGAARALDSGGVIASNYRRPVLYPSRLRIPQIDITSPLTIHTSATLHERGAISALAHRSPSRTGPCRVSNSGCSRPADASFGIPGTS